MIKIINQLKGVLLGTLIVVFVCGCGKSTEAFLEKETLEKENLSQTASTEKSESTQEVEEATEKREKGLVYVYVCGAVENPDVYGLPEGSRVCDAFAEAGGFTKEAATFYWNQARLLEDGEMLYVPTTEEVENGTLPDQVYSVEDKYDEDNKININKASLEELMTIPGIGQAKALAIIKYRQEHGSFTSIDEVKNIEGIKDGVFSKMKEYIDID